MWWPRPRIRGSAPQRRESRLAARRQSRRQGRERIGKHFRRDLAWRISRRRCANNPKPVTSVQAEAPASFIASAAARFSVAIETCAAANPAACPRPICWPNVSTPVPSGLGQYQRVASLRFFSAAATAGSINPVIAKPSLISSSLTLWPPTSATPASSKISMAPASQLIHHLARQLFGRKRQDAQRLRGSPPIA